MARTHNRPRTPRKKVTASARHQRPGARRCAKPRADNFVFEITGRRPLFTQEQVLQQLRAFARTVRNRSFTHREFNAWKNRDCSASTVRSHFGSWPKALAAIGIRGGEKKHYDPRRLIEHLEKVWRIMGRSPGVNTLRDHGEISVGPYIRNWGSLRRACILFTRYKRGEITMDALLRAGKNGKRQDIPSGVRWDVLQRDGHRCKACGRSPQHHNVTLEVDHIVPVSAGGSDDPSNLQALCFQCNRGKRDKPMRAKPAHAPATPMLFSAISRRARRASGRRQAAA